MSSNPYAPPSARVEDVEVSNPQAAQVAYFPVSPLKLVVLSTLTFGLYQLYWFYKNWALIKSQEKSDIIPVLRAIFGVFFCYSCYQRMSEQGVWNGLPRMPAGALAFGWIATTIASRLPDPYWLVTLTSTLFMIPVQRHVNRLNAILAPGHDPNDRFTAWNWVGIILGSLFLLLALAGLFLPEEFIE